MSCGTVFVTTTSSIGDSSINLGASADNIPCVAKTYILYAPLSFRINEASTNDLTSSEMRKQLLLHFSETDINSQFLLIEKFETPMNNYLLPSMSSTIIAILPPTSPTTCMAGFSLAANWGSTTPKN